MDSLQSSVNILKVATRGRVAQLGERIVRNDEVAGSIPVSSTKFFPNPVIWIAQFAACYYLLVRVWDRMFSLVLVMVSILTGCKSEQPTVDAWYDSEMRDSRWTVVHNPSRFLRRVGSYNRTPPTFLSSILFAPLFPRPFSFLSLRSSPHIVPFMRQ